MTIRINKLEMTWTEEGCVAKAEGFSGVMLTCPRCQALLPRNEVHRCGDEVLPPNPNPKPTVRRPVPAGPVKGESLLRRRAAGKKGKQ